MPRHEEPFEREAAASELQRIADWWSRTSVDDEFGGFAGEIDTGGRAVAGAPKGIVLNSRILWFFSALATASAEDRYRTLATRAWDYLLGHFDDPADGGAVWELTHTGAVANGKKQTYSLCFCIYAFCAYFEATGDPHALGKALEYAALIEDHARDSQHDGYVEAFARDWKPIDDYRLGSSDLNAPKTMNTHLHLLEAYSALHRAARSERTAALLGRAIDLLIERIYAADKGHLQLYFDIAWNNQASVVSYGHDIEASWLLWEAGQCLGDAGRLTRLSPVVEGLARSCLEEGIGDRGQVCNEFNIVSRHRSDEAIWWVQAEALVGFLNAYQVTGDSRFRGACDGVWRFVRDHLIDPQGGDWHWNEPARAAPGGRHYKAGFWKGPYHNGRAMLESISRLEVIGDD